MQRVFTNLLENAVNHAKNVEITVTTPGDQIVQIDVAVDGPGIPDDIKSAVFEPFVRGQSGRTIGEGAGFGLGLSIVRTLVESHGGSVEMLDRATGGLTVRIILPLAREEAAQAAT